MFAIHMLSLLAIYLESSWWKVGDMVAKKIEEHQLLCTREGLGVDGLNSILLQVDALNVWNRFQSISLEVCDTIFTFTEQEEHLLQSVT